MEPMITDAANTIGTATADLQSQLLDVGGKGLVVGVAIFALTKGWSLLRRFVG